MMTINRKPIAEMKIAHPRASNTSSATDKPLVVAPKPKLRQFDFLRAVFCAAVLVFHCNSFFNGLKADGATKEWGAFLRNPLFFPVSMAGINAVPIFFMMSAFFIVHPLIRKLEKGQAEPFAAMLLSRYLRLVTFILPLIIVGLAFDRSFYTVGGGVNLHKVLGYLTMSGNLFSTAGHGKWMVDITMLPCWSLVTDFQGSAILLLGVPLSHRLFGARTWPLFAALAAGLAYRFSIVNQDWGCNNMMPTMSKFHPSGPFLTGSEMALQQASEYYPKVNFKEVPMGIELCKMTNMQSMNNYFPRLYTPTLTRVTPFFVGAIMAINFHYASANASGRSTAMGWLWFVLSCVFCLTLVMPVDVDNLPPLGAQVVMEVANHTLLSTAVAFLTYCAIVPAEHAYHAPRLAKFMGDERWATAASYSSWMYALHWFPLLQLAKYVPLPVGYGVGLFISLVTALITAPLCVLARTYVEAPLEAFRKRAAGALAATLSNPALVPMSSRSPRTPGGSKREKGEKLPFPVAGLSAADCKPRAKVC